MNILPRMKRALLQPLLWALIFTGTCWAMAAPPVGVAAGPEWQGDTRVYRAEGWELRIEHLQRGTRSEGQRGTLTHDGQPVRPETPGQLLDTPLGRLKHFGDDRPHPWSVSGWNFADSSRRRSAAASPNSPPSPQEHAPMTTTIEIPRDGGQFNAMLENGGRLEVALIGQPGTGYAWDLADGEWDRILTSTGRSDGAPEDPRVLGGSATMRWSFRARAPGAAALVFRYRRAWEQDVPPVQTATVDVRVTP